MSYNNLSGTLPSGLGLILFLEYFLSDGNGLSGTISSELRQCKNLITISFALNTSLSIIIISELYSAKDVSLMYFGYEGTDVLCTCCSYYTNTYCFA